MEHLLCTDSVHHTADIGGKKTDRYGPGCQEVYILLGRAGQAGENTTRKWGDVTGKTGPAGRWRAVVSVARKGRLTAKKAGTIRAGRGCSRPREGQVQTEPFSRKGKEASKAGPEWARVQGGEDVQDGPLDIILTSMENHRGCICCISGQRKISASKGYEFKSENNFHDNESRMKF